jgi:8-oxo-dGTP diphosphatase
LRDYSLDKANFVKSFSLINSKDVKFERKKAIMSKEPRVGVGVLITKDNSVLLLKRKNVHGAGSWSPPGGHLEFGEAPEACALREAYEETAVRITDLTFRGITNDVFETYGKHYITLWFEGKYVSGEAVVNAPYEASQVGWFAWNSLPQPLFLPFRNLLDGKCYSV